MMSGWRPFTRFHRVHSDVRTLTFSRVMEDEGYAALSVVALSVRAHRWRQVRSRGVRRDATAGARRNDIDGRLTHTLAIMLLRFWVRRDGLMRKTQYCMPKCGHHEVWDRPIVIRGLIGPSSCR